MNNRLVPPHEHLDKVNVWVDEAIWGHRFYNDQTPWLVLLEFLAIFQSRHAVNRALNEKFTDEVHEKFDYMIPRLPLLRKIIFNNPHIQRIDSTRQDDTASWKAWMDEMGDEFSYLQKHFNGFMPLAHIVDFFQSSEVEAYSNRRWSSKFIFPYGGNCLYADLPSSMRTPDRRFFARGGELLYLMLNRSEFGTEIANRISATILKDDKPWNMVIKALLPDDYRDEEVSSPIGYLPFKERDEYQQLAKTWLQILKLDLIGEALLDPLMRLSALHMLLYMLKRSHEEIGEDKQPRIILEIASDRKTAIFNLSSDCFVANRQLSLRAIRAYIESIKSSENWEQAMVARSPFQAVRDLLKKQFICKNISWNDIHHDQMLEDVIIYAEKRHKQHVNKVHAEWCRRIGLAVVRRGIGSWYSPDDLLLKALVMCLVEEREEFHKFLEKMYKVFHLVVGVSEAEKAYDKLPTDRNEFIQNTQRLEMRLKSLGLLKRLSDDCAYVENPFKRYKR